MKRLGLFMLLMTAVFVVGVLYFLFFNGRDAARDVRVLADFENLSEQVRHYAKITGGFPTSEQGLNALVERPNAPLIPTEWRPTFPSIPEDPWGRPYNYRSAGNPESGTFELLSLGPDVSDSADDITRSFTF